MQTKVVLVLGILASTWMPLTDGLPSVPTGIDTGAGVGAVIAGGDSNMAHASSAYGSISGGLRNSITAEYAHVLGGIGNTVSSKFGVASGEQNVVTGSGSVVIGHGNTVSGKNSFVVGSGVSAGASNSMLMQGTVGAAKVKQIADERLKEKATTASGEELLAIIERLRVVNFDYTDDFCRHLGQVSCLADMRNRIGVLAQEVQRVNPVAVESDLHHFELKDKFLFDAFGGRDGGITAAIKDKLYKAYAYNMDAPLSHILSDAELASLPSPSHPLLGSLLGIDRDSLEFGTTTLDTNSTAYSETETDVPLTYDTYSVKSFFDEMMNRQPVTMRVVPDVMSVDTNVLLYQAIGALQELSRRQIAVEDDTFTKSDVLRLCIGAVLLSFTASITVMVVAIAFLMPRKQQQQQVLGALLPQKMQHHV